MQALIDAALEAAAAVDASFATTFEARLWAQTVSAGVQRTVVLDDMGGLLPQAAQPHVVAALALALVREQGAVSTLSAGMQDLLAILDGERSVPVRSREPFPERNLWTADLAGEDQVPSVAYLRAMRRAYAAERDVDAAICVLEAHAQQDALTPALLVEALAQPSLLLRWTAARLTPADEGFDEVRAQAAEDPELLVRRRVFGVQ